MPPAVPAVIFLSGGQSDEDAVLNLNAINAYEGRKPWPLTFCYGRALQVSSNIFSKNAALKTWKGNPDKVQDAQAAFLERAKLCSQASLGELEPVWKRISEFFSIFNLQLHHANSNYM